MRDRACRAVKIIELVREWLKAPFPPGWNDAKAIESFGCLIQNVEDLMISPPQALESGHDPVLEGIDYEISYVESGIIRLSRIS